MTMGYSFEVAIKKHLDEVAKKDSLFAKAYAKPNKSIKECCNYIIGEARKNQDKGIAAIPDEEVYGMAIHYYDEDNIKVDVKDLGDVKVAHGTSAAVAKPKKATRKAKVEVIKPEPVTEPVAAEAESEDGGLDIPLFD